MGIADDLVGTKQASKQVEEKRLRTEDEMMFLDASCVEFNG